MSNPKYSLYLFVSSEVIYHSLARLRREVLHLHATVFYLLRAYTVSGYGVNGDITVDGHLIATLLYADMPQYFCAIIRNFGVEVKWRVHKRMLQLR